MVEHVCSYSLMWQLNFRARVLLSKERYCRAGGKREREMERNTYKNASERRLFRSKGPENDRQSSLSQRNRSQIRVKKKNINFLDLAKMTAVKYTFLKKRLLKSIVLQTQLKKFYLDLVQSFCNIPYPVKYPQNASNGVPLSAPSSFRP